MIKIKLATIVVIARVLKLHRCPNPIVFDRLVGGKNHRVSLSNVDIKPINGVRDMTNSINLQVQ